MLQKLFSIFIFALCMPSLSYAQALKVEQASEPRPEKKERSKVFNAESFMLDNGMQVVVIPNRGKR